MAKMFRNYTDDNGVTTSCNSHAPEDYGPAPADMRTKYPIIVRDSEGVSIVPAALNIVQDTRDRVLFRVGRPGAMNFDGDLLPRAERLENSQNPNKKDSKKE